MTIRPINRNEASPELSLMRWPMPAPARGGLDHFDERVLFMCNRIDGDALRSHGKCGGRASRLHVVVAGHELIVTEAEDLHRPGGSIVGRKLFDFPGGMTFRLQQQCSPGRYPPGFRPATGIAVLSCIARRWRLSATAMLQEPASARARFIHAVEEPRDA